MHLKKILGKKFFNLSHKKSAILAGCAAQAVLVAGVLSVSKNPYQAGFDILYAFFVLIPISYYNMRYHEKCEKPYDIE